MLETAACSFQIEAVWDLVGLDRVQLFLGGPRLTRGLRTTDLWIRAQRVPRVSSKMQRGGMMLEEVRKLWKKLPGHPIGQTKLVAPKGLGLLCPESLPKAMWSIVIIQLYFSPGRRIQ